MALIQQPDLLMAMVAVLWRIWRSRNWVVFEGKQFGIPALMQKFSQQYEEWVSLPLDQSLPSPRTSIPLAPPVGDTRVVCFWDGATRQGAPSAGGMVLMTSSHDLLLARGVRFPDMRDPMVVELLTLREAIGWCLGLGFAMVRFEGDAKVVIDKVNSWQADDNRVGAILEEVLHYFESYPGLSVRFVGRNNNRIAHRVARKALSLSPAMSRVFDFQTWLGTRM
ncbi:unnamed protein product [Linum trigynum]|uniref:RNase H type-1 domain-containing protein n=1 Tax=Linum trigynum TaxID=586398 RepID=A0AAV2DX75_9ROSI